MKRRSLKGAALFIAVEAIACSHPETPHLAAPAAAPASTAQATSPEHLAAHARRREEIHSLIHKGLSDHDGAIELRTIGDITSVPALIHVLERNPLYPHGQMICTRAHALQALTRIVGRDLGPETKPWQDWWAAHLRDVDSPPGQPN